MKKVLIRAYLNENFGDDLFVYLLCNRYPNTQFNIIGDSKYSKLTNEISNLKYIKSDSAFSKIVNKLYKHYQVLKKEKVCNHRDIALYNLYARFFDENIFVTGSYFIQNSEWCNELEDMRWYNTSPHILGCNFGPYSDEDFFRIHEFAFSKCSEVVFRESYSYKLFSKLSNIDYSSDLVFGLRHEKIESFEENEYVVSVVSLSKDNDEWLIALQEQYIKLLNMIISQIISSGYNVTLMSFCSEQGDDIVIDKVLTNFSNHENVKTWYYREKGITKSLAKLKSSKGIVASRYHAMILGFLFEKKVLPLVYSSKMTNVLNDIEYEYPIIDISDNFSSDIKIMDMFGQIDKDKLVKLVNQTNKYFKKLDSKLT